MQDRYYTDPQSSSPWVVYTLKSPKNPNPSMVEDKENITELSTPTYSEAVKFHVSINHEDLSRKGTDQKILSFLQEKGIAHFKLVPSDKTKKALDNADGKELTIYMQTTLENQPKDQNESDPAFWDKFIHDLVDFLKKENIRPGTCSKGDLSFPNSESYVYFRDPNNILDNYVAINDLQKQGFTALEARQLKMKNSFEEFMGNKAGFIHKPPTQPLPIQGLSEITLNNESMIPLSEIESNIFFGYKKYQTMPQDPVIYFVALFEIPNNPLKFNSPLRDTTLQKIPNTKKKYDDFKEKLNTIVQDICKETGVTLKELNINPALYCYFYKPMIVYLQQNKDKTPDDFLDQIDFDLLLGEAVKCCFRNRALQVAQLNQDDPVYLNGISEDILVSHLKKLITDHPLANTQKLSNPPLGRLSEDILALFNHDSEKEALAHDLNIHIISALENSDLVDLFEEFITVEGTSFKLNEPDESKLANDTSKEIARLIKTQTNAFLENHRGKATNEELQKFTHELVLKIGITNFALKHEDLLQPDNLSLKWSELGDQIEKAESELSHLKNEYLKIKPPSDSVDPFQQQLDDYQIKLLALKTTIKTTDEENPLDTPPNISELDTPPPATTATVPPKIKRAFSLDLQEDDILATHYRQEIRLSNGDSGQKRFCHVLAARTKSQEEFDEVIHAVNQFSTSTAIHTALSTNPSEPTKESTIVALIRDPPGKKDYSASDGIMEGVAGFFHYWEQDKDKNSPLCIGGKCDIDTLIQFLDCCLATGREFQFGNAVSALTIRLSKDIDPISIPIGTNVSLDIPEVLENYVTDNQELRSKLEILKQQINDQNKKPTPDERQPYIRKVNNSILFLKNDPHYKENIAALTKINQFKSYDERFKRRKSEPLVAYRPPAVSDSSFDEKNPAIDPPPNFNPRKSFP